MKDTKILDNNYIDESTNVSEEETEEFNADNLWVAKVEGRAVKGWRPRVVQRPGNIQFSRTQLRGIGVHNG